MTSSGSGTKTNRLESSLKLYSDNHIYKPTSTMLTRVGGRTLASIFHTLPCSTPFPTATPYSDSLQRRNKTGPKRCVAAQHQAILKIPRSDATKPSPNVASRHNIRQILKIPCSDATKQSLNVASRHKVRQFGRSPAATQQNRA